MANAGINLNELILDHVISLNMHDLEDGSLIGRLTNLEDSSLQTAAEGEEITDNIGALITKIFRAKTGRFEATNSLFSFDLLAQQYGAKKEIATVDNKINVPCEETLKAVDGKITLSHTPIQNNIKYIYHMVRGNVAEKYTLGVTASTTEFSISDNVITVPTDVEGHFYVEYEYESDSANRVVNNTNNFPEAASIKIYAMFRDKCNENLKVAGVIVAAKGKIDASSVDTSLTATGKHSFAIDFMKDYCDPDADLFSVILAA